MYAAPVAVLPAARRGGAIAGPVLAICCLIFVLFLIAATIVLALIPVYLPTSNPGNLNGLLRRSSILDFSGNLGNDRELDAQSCDNIRNMMARGLNIQPNAFTLRRCALATAPGGGRRKRRVHSLSRHRRGPTSQGLQQIFIVFDLIVSVCGQCLVTVSTFTQDVTIFVDGVGRTISVTVTIIVGEVSIPGIQPPTTIATTSGATTSAGSDSTTAGSDSTTAGSDSTTAGSDSTTAGSDSTTAGSDSTTAGSDSTTAGSDSTTAGSDSTTAGSDSTTAGSDSTTAGSDSTTAGSDSTTAGSDSTSPTVTAVVS